MKKLAFLISIILYLGLSKLSAQDYGNKVDPLKLCVAIQSNNFISDVEAENALDRILSVIGASKRFVLQPCDNINNAVAISYKGVRYILYDKEFMNSISSGNNWSNLFILAHEVGHHINGHSLDLVLYAAEAVEAETLASKRQQELEADEFAGFVLGKLGASFSETTTVLNSLANDRDDTYSTHPAKSKRLVATSEGYNNGYVNKVKSYQTKSKVEIADEYFYGGLEKIGREDYYGSISDFIKVIELNYNLSQAYNNMANSKYFLKDYVGAIEDYTKSIAVNPSSGNPYYGRGVSKSFLDDYNGAIIDFTKAIELEHNLPVSYVQRGLQKDFSDDYNGAIIDFTKAIELDPNDGYKYYIRGFSKAKLENNKEACHDAQKAKKLGFDSSDLILIVCK